MFNNKPVVFTLADQLDNGQKPTYTSRPRRRLTSEPTLPARLPSTGKFKYILYTTFTDYIQGFIQREAEQIAPMAILKQLRRTPTPPTPTEEEVRPRRLSVTSQSSSSPSSPTAGKKAARPKSMPSTSWKEPQVLRVAVFSIETI